MKIKQYIFIARPNKFVKGDMSCFSLFPSKDMEGYEGGYILVDEIEVEVNLNEDSIRQSILDSLGTKETELRARFEMSMNEIKEERQSLLAIEHKQ